MKNIIAILLVFCLALPFWGSYSYLKMEKRQVKRTIKRQIMKGIDRDKLVLLKFSKKETQTLLRWEHPKEFEFYGQMYDIVHKELRGDSIWYWCWWDYEETALNRYLAILVAKSMGKNPQNTETQNKLRVFSGNLFCNDRQNLNLKENLSYEIFFQYLADHYSSVEISPPAPPPKA